MNRVWIKSCDRIWSSLFFAFIFLTNSGILAQDRNNLPFPIQHPYFDLDYATFAANEPAKANIELYLQVANPELQFVRHKNGFEAQVEISIYIFDDQKELVDQKFHRRTVPATTYEATTAVTTTSLFQFVFNLPTASSYSALVELLDHHTQRKSTCDLPITIESFATDTLQLSQIELTQEIQPADSSDLSNIGYIKNSRTLFPCPNHQYSVEQKIMGFYFEVYNLLDSPGTTAKTLVAHYQIINHTGETKLEKSYRLAKPGATAAISFNCPITELSAGKYSLLLTVLDEDSHQQVQRKTDFFLWSNRFDSQYSQVSNLIDVLQYIASPEEMKKLKSTRNDQITTVLAEFWRAKDPTPSTEENELMKDFYYRVAIANQTFATGQLAGWKTDQGRIFIRYGAPDRTYRTPLSTQETKFEIWDYQSANILFVFIDKYGFGEYRLWHPSTFSLLDELAKQQEELNGP